MNTHRMTCGNCGGDGHLKTWKAISMNEETGTGTLKCEDVKCEKCNGTGWVEYITFSVDEAKAILNHCGLGVDC